MGYLNTSLIFQVESICLYSSKQPTFPTTSGDYWESDDSLSMSLFRTFTTGTTAEDTNVYEFVQNCTRAVPTAERQLIEYILFNRDKFREPLVQHIAPFLHFGSYWDGH